MANTTYIDGSAATPITASWLNDINTVCYTALGNGTSVPTTAAQVITNIGAATAAAVAAVYLPISTASTTYAPLTGTGASGTWGISISGNAATATTATTATSITGLGNAAAISQAILPAGVILPFAGATPPSGFLAIPTTATNISRTTYATLFAAIGTTWGAGDGSTTFGLPYVGADGTLLQSNANLGTATVGQVINHQHLLGGGSGGGGSGAISIGGTGVYSGSPVDPTTRAASGGPQNTAAGSRVNFIIKY